jgi:uridylate kinase
MTTVLSLGGSIVAPETPDSEFVASFVALVAEHLAFDKARRLIIVVGGGGPARQWQKSYREIVARTPMGAAHAPDVARPEDVARLEDANAQDWIGIMATRLNAQLVKAALGGLCPQEVVIDPSAVTIFRGRALVAAGWKPGFSTDFDAVLLAERFGANRVLNLSNIEKVYTDDPRKSPAARPIDAISWADFRSLVGDEWSPGKHAPFDPIASKKASEIGLEVICAAGKDLANLRAILGGSAFTGTVIGPR